MATGHGRWPTVAVIGAGSWGTTMASMLSSRADTTLWVRRPEQIERMAVERVNHEYLPGFRLPDGLSLTSSLADAVTGARVVVMAVPSHGFRAVLSGAAPHVGADVPVVSLTKGLEEGTRRRMTEIVGEVLPGHVAGVLTGPNLAKEVLAGQPAASVLAMTDHQVAVALQELFTTDVFRVYTNPDVVGCELAGALKNVMAIALGMVDGLGFGDNSRAALITRGLAELSRLGVALGGDPRTFAGLAGMGDLVATSVSAQSRNHHVGQQLGEGRSLTEIVGHMRMVAEGVRSSRVVVELAAEHGVEMPIAEQVVAVCHHGRPAVEAMWTLMRRQSKPELPGPDPVVTAVE